MLLAAFRTIEQMRLEPGDLAFLELGVQIAMIASRTSAQSLIDGPPAERAAPRPQPAQGEACAGPRQTAHHRPDGTLQHPRNLFVSQAFHISQYDDLAVRFTQRIQRGADLKLQRAPQQQGFGGLLVAGRTSRLLPDRPRVREPSNHFSKYCVESRTSSGAPLRRRPPTAGASPPARVDSIPAPAPRRRRGPGSAPARSETASRDRRPWPDASPAEPFLSL